MTVFFFFLNKEIIKCFSVRLQNTASGYISVSTHKTVEFMFVLEKNSVILYIGKRTYLYMYIQYIYTNQADIMTTDR